MKHGKKMAPKGGKPKGAKGGLKSPMGKGKGGDPKYYNC